MSSSVHPSGFTVDSRTGPASRTALSSFSHGWSEELGIDQQLPTFTRTSATRMRGTASVARLADVTLVDADLGSMLRTQALPDHHDREVRLYAVHHGSLTLDDPDNRGRHVIPAGGFALQHVRRSVHFETSSSFRMQVLALPAEPLAPLLRGQLRTGSIATAEVRLLLAHARTAQQSIQELGPAGGWAVRNSLLELTRAVTLERLDVHHHDRDLAPPLVSAARALADTRLTDPDLSPTRLARDLTVSLRTLQRAFAETGEPISEYIRRRRLENARQALLNTPGLSVAQAAAHWQFTDSSHFVKAFRKVFGTTPGDLNRRI